MITAEQVRDHLLSLPRVQATTHFRRPAFAVDGTSFASLADAGTQLTLRLDRTTADDAVADDPSTYELIWKGGTTFIGLSISLSTAHPPQVRALLDASWQHMISTSTEELAPPRGRASRQDPRS